MKNQKNKKNNRRKSNSANTKVRKNKAKDEIVDEIEIGSQHSDDYLQNINEFKWSRVLSLSYRMYDGDQSFTAKIANDTFDHESESDKDLEK